MGMALTVGERDALKRFCGRRAITYSRSDDVSHALEGLTLQGAAERSGAKWTLTESGADELERSFPGCSPHAKKRATKKKKRAAPKRPKKRTTRKKPSKSAKVVAKARRTVARAKTRAKKWYAGRRGVWRA